MFTRKQDVRRLRIPRNADKRRNLHCRGTARVCGRADKTAFTVQRYGLSALRLSNRACGTFSRVDLPPITERDDADESEVAEDED